MSEQPTVPDDTRDELIEKAVQVIAERRAVAAGSQASDAAAFLADAREDVAALAGSGVLPDPAIDPTSTWVLNRVRETLGTPEGVRITEHAKEVVRERDTWESEYERVRDLKLTDLADALAERDERQARLDAVPNILRQHYLAWIECDHDRQMDNPQCACSQIDLGWHPTVGDAVNAWIEHVRAALQGDQPGQDASPGPHHPAGSPETHFPTDPQMPGSTGESTAVPASGEAEEAKTDGGES